MASFTERIRLIFDVDANPATKGFGSFAGSIREADGASAKFKAGLSGINKAGSAFALAGGAALIGAAMKGATEFVNLAKASSDLGKAIGTTTEDASRWIAVADDAGISAETLQTGMGKIAKTLDTGKWGDYGIATRDAGGNVRSTNDIMLDALDVLGKTKDETERARIGNELFGKGFANLAPLVGQTRAEYQKMLDTVSAGQVITDDEVEKAEKLRLAQDNLGDALKDVEMALGSVAAAGSPVIETLGKVITKVAGFVSVFTGGDAKSMSKPLKEFGEAAAAAEGNIGEMGRAFSNLVVDAWNAQSTKKLAQSIGHPEKAFEVFQQAFADLAASSPAYAEQVYTDIMRTVSAAEHGGGASKEYADKWGLTRDSVKKLLPHLAAAADGIGDTADAASDASSDISSLKDAYAGLLGVLDAQDALDNVQQGFDDVKQKAVDAWIATQNGADDAASKTRDYQSDLRDLERDVITYADAVGGIPKDVVSKIIAAINEGDLTKARALFDELKKPETKTITIETEMGDGTGPKAPRGANYATAPTVHVGPDGKTTVTGWHYGMAPVPGVAAEDYIGVNGSGGTWSSAQPTSGGPARSSHPSQGSTNTYTGNIYITAPDLSPAAVAKALAEWQRRTGLAPGAAPRNAR